MRMRHSDAPTTILFFIPASLALFLDQFSTDRPISNTKVRLEEEEEDGTYCLYNATDPPNRIGLTKEDVDAFREAILKGVFDGLFPGYTFGRSQR